MKEKMWKFVLLILGIAYVRAQQPGQQQFNSPCLSKFDQIFRKCYVDNGNFKLDVIFSLITNGTSGPIPSGANRQQLTQSLCQVREVTEKCVTPLAKQVQQQQKCAERENLMMTSTVQSTTRAISALCGVQPEMPACLNKFDAKFRQCMTQNQVVPDHFFKLLGNTTEGLSMNMQQLNASTCRPQTQRTIVQCASASLQQLASQCTQQEQFMVGQTLQNMMTSFQAICSGRPPVIPGSVPPCLQKFEKDFDKCAVDNAGVPMQELMMLLSKGVVPQGKTMEELNQTICGNIKPFEICGKDAVKDSGCKGRDLLITEGTFANVFITVGAYCHDSSMPGACMLTLQSQFAKCFDQVGLSQKAYLGNITAHKGALLGADRKSAELYCSKRPELYACMKKIMHRCPGAEQTMTLTGFDLASMERAVGVLCADIDEYLIGLKCFEKPSQQSSQCVDQMGQAVTSLSAQEMSRGLSLKTFFKSFCDIRIKHVECDTNAWSSCDPKAVALKRKFECHLLPAKCHDLNEAQLDNLCPADAIVKPHKCLDDMRMEMNKCVSKYGIDLDKFLVNVTHDRSGMIGNHATAVNFCKNREDVFKCMRAEMDRCPGVRELLEYWGHQQDQIESSISLLCDNIGLYDAGLSCFRRSKQAVDACIAKTESQMRDIQSKNMPKTSYYNQFCSVKMDHLNCDLNAMRAECSEATLGLKTEFECHLIPDRCYASARSNIKQICTPKNYAKNLRQTGAAVPGSSSTGTGNGGGSGAGSIYFSWHFGTLVVALGSLLLTLL